MPSNRRKFKKSTTTAKPTSLSRVLKGVASSNAISDVVEATAAPHKVAPVTKRPPRTSPLQLASAKKFKPMTEDGVVCKFDQYSHPIPFDKRKKHDYQVPKDELTKVKRMFHLRPEELVVPSGQNHVEEQLLRCLLAQFQTLDAYLPNWPSRLPNKSRMAYYDLLEIKTNMPDTSLILDSLESIPHQQYCMDAMRCLHTAMQDLIPSLPQSVTSMEVCIFT